MAEYLDGVKRETREIDGETYYVAYLPVSQALDMGDAIMKAVAPALEGMKGGIDAELSIGLVASMLTKANGKAMIMLLKQMMPLIEVATDSGSKPLSGLWEKHFQGRLDVLAKVARFFLEVQYGSFSKLLEGSSNAK